MTSRALLIGCATNGLVGVDNDLALLREELGRRGFDSLATVTGDDATRGGILEALNRLAEETQPGDRVVLAYSGHGARLPFADSAARIAKGQGGYLHFLVPTDFAESTATDFRGLLAPEVSDIQWRLTDVAASVTTILDCCHSGSLARDWEVRPKALTDWQMKNVPAEGAAAMLERLNAPTAAGRRRPGESNPLAVRVVACAPHETAFEIPGEGGSVGLLTQRLVTALRKAGERPVSWNTVMAQVRAEVARRIPAQRPDVEGPADLIPFSADQVDQRSGLSVTGGVGKPTIVVGGGLLGLRAGDEVTLTGPAGEDMGEATVDQALDADVSLAGVAAPPVGTTARAARSTVIDRWVTVEESASSPALLAGIANTSGLAVLQPGDANTDPVMATIRTDAEGSLVVVDRIGQPWRSAAVNDDERGIAWVVALLDTIAKGERLRGRTRADSPGGYESGVVTVGEVQGPSGDGSQSWVRLPESGGRVPVETRLRVTLTNNSSTLAFVSVLDVGLSGRTSLATSDTPSGRPLKPGETSTIAFPDGIALSWPGDVPASGPRSESLVTLATSTPFDARVLVAREPAVPAPGGGVRGEGPKPAAKPAGESATREPVGLQVDLIHLDFLVVPDPGQAFAIVETAPTGLAALKPRGAAPGAIRVTLDEVCGPPGRLDWLLVTALDDSRLLQAGSASVDGAPQAIPIFDGPYEQVVDLAMWFTPVGGGSDASAAPSPISVDAGTAATVDDLIGAASAELSGWAVEQSTGVAGLLRASFIPIQAFARRPEPGTFNVNGLQFALTTGPAST